MRLKILLTIGTRPQLVKAKILLNTLEKFCVDCVVVHTGQHYDSSLYSRNLEALQLRTPKYDLTLGKFNRKSTIKDGVKQLLTVIENEKPNIIWTIGDSNPALIGAIAAVGKNTFLIHSEAGLRSGNGLEPEERNRILIDSLADMLFCSTPYCKSNLDNEQVIGQTEITGDLLKDSYLRNQSAFKRPDLRIKNSDGFYMFTIHRKQNIKRILKVLSLVKLLKIPLIWPIHPGTKKSLESNGLIQFAKDICELTLCPPVNYLEMGWLLAHCQGVITDSVGIQVESYLAQKPCVVVRSEMEHKILSKIGWSQLIDPESQNAQIEILRFFDEYAHIESSFDESLFGDGYSSEKMVKAVLDRFH